jgi:hypothetical protein
LADVTEAGVGADSQISDAKRKSRLTAAQVKNLPPGKYHDGGGTGLLLRVDETGARLWIQRIMVRGKRREMGLGGYPTVTLAEAREAALENKRLAFRGGDPLAERRRVKTIPTFAEAAKATHAELSPTWKNPKDRDAFLSTLETYIFPSVAPMCSAGASRKGTARRTRRRLQRWLCLARSGRPSIARPCPMPRCQAA